MSGHKIIFEGQTLKFRFPVHKVESTCPYHAPVVISHTRGLDEKFTRSPYWLQCPHLISKIHKMESQGWIHTLQDWIDGPFKSQWEEFTHHVPALLKETLPHEYFQCLKLEGRANIGGVKDSGRIKCLHAHYSFYLVHNLGFVGKFVHGLLQWRKQREGLKPLVYCEPESLECELGRMA